MHPIEELKASKDPEFISVLSYQTDQLLERVRGVLCVAMLSGDGLLLVHSGSWSRDQAERFAAMSSGLYGTANGFAENLNATLQVMVEQRDMTFSVMSCALNTRLAVAARPEVDASMLAYEMQQMVRAIHEFAELQERRRRGE